MLHYPTKDHYPYIVPPILEKGIPEYTDKEAFADYREELRKHLLDLALLGEFHVENAQGEFNGYGDSGNYYISTGNSLLDKFLSHVLDAAVKFDWYNNDGGGGDIEWNLKEDKLIVNGYQYETISNDVMVEHEA